MPKIKYLDHNFRANTMAMIGQVNGIIADYEEMGYSLTLRQVYYRMVAAALIPNSLKSYKRLGATINKAREAGLIDWEAIEDRTRALRGLPSWSSPESIVFGTIHRFHRDLWRTQDYRVEVWVEKDALSGVVGRTCNDLDVDYFSTRGYSSAPEVWKAAQRFDRYIRGGQKVVVIHMADHDPSGLDMTRDIDDRLELFMTRYGDVKRIALNMDQVEEHQPPPNPAKMTDSRYGTYMAEHGTSSWELDALDPPVIDALIRAEVAKWCDQDLYDKEVARQEVERARIKKAYQALKDGDI